MRGAHPLHAPSRLVPLTSTRVALDGTRETVVCVRVCVRVRVFTVYSLCIMKLKRAASLYASPPATPRAGVTRVT
jgi:hypothetical protein